MATRTLTYLYDTFDDATRTVRDLEAAGIPHSDISMVANNADGRYATGCCCNSRRARRYRTVAPVAWSRQFSRLMEMPQRTSVAPDTAAPLAQAA